MMPSANLSKTLPIQILYWVKHGTYFVVSAFWASAAASSLHLSSRNKRSTPIAPAKMQDPFKKKKERGGRMRSPSVEMWGKHKRAGDRGRCWGDQRQQEEQNLLGWKVPGSCCLGHLPVWGHLLTPHIFCWFLTPFVMPLLSQNQQNCKLSTLLYLSSRKINSLELSL